MEPPLSGGKLFLQYTYFHSYSTCYPGNPACALVFAIRETEKCVIDNRSKIFELLQILQQLNYPELPDSWNIFRDVFSV
jgi:hypothetical protein